MHLHHVPNAGVGLLLVLASCFSPGNPPLETETTATPLGTTSVGTTDIEGSTFGDAPGGINGGDGKLICGAGGNGWLTVLADPAGQPACNYGGHGGFGGGGGSGCSPNPCNEIHTAGGGGGYSGGGAGGACYYFGGGGGGSFNAGSNQDNSAGVRMGDGLVTISW